MGTLILAAIGVYAVLARSIAQRTHEIGIHRALGSSNFRIFLKFGKQGFYFLLAGTLLGSAPALIGFTYFLFAEFDLTDISFILLVFLAVTFVVFAIITVACYVPTRMAISMEPGDALRITVTELKIFGRSTLIRLEIIPLTQQDSSQKRDVWPVVTSNN